MEFFQTIELYQKYEKSLELGTMPFPFLYSTDFTETIKSKTSPNQTLGLYIWRLIYWLIGLTRLDSKLPFPTL